MNALFSPVEKPFENKISYEAEEIFYLGDLGYKNLMFSDKSVDHDDEYIYCITSDDDYHNSGHGVLIVTDREGKNIRSLVVCEEARKAGHDECFAYELMSVDVYDDVIIVSGQDAPMFPRYTELVCFDKETLQVLWHWHSEDGGWNNYSSTSKWADNYIFYYDDNNANDVIWFTVLDKTGNELITRRITNGGRYDRGCLYVWGDYLYIRSKDSPYVVYDLKLLLDNTIPDEECRHYVENDMGITTNSSSIISDSVYAFFPARYTDKGGNKKEFISAYSLHTNTMVWRTELNGVYSQVRAIMELKNGKLYVPADYGSVYCLDLKNGKLLWHTDIRKRPDETYDVNLLTKPTVVSDKWLCLCCNSTQELIILSTKNGDIVARIRISMAPNCINAFSEGDYLYLAGDDALYRFTFKEK